MGILAFNLLDLLLVVFVNEGKIIVKTIVKVLDLGIWLGERKGFHGLIMQCNAIDDF